MPTVTLNIPSELADTHRLAGWSVTVGQLKEIAELVLHDLNDPSYKERVETFFLPACANDAKYNFSEIMAALYKEDPAFLCAVIKLKQHDQFLFDNIFDFVDFALGAQPICDKSLPLVFSPHTRTRVSKHLLGINYHSNNGKIEYKVPARWKMIIKLSSKAQRKSFEQLFKLYDRLNKQYSLFTLKLMLKNGIGIETICDNIADLSQAIPMRLCSLFPDQAGRETVVFILASDDHNGSLQFSKTYLDESNMAVPYNLQIAANVYEHYNVKFRMVETTIELFNVIKAIAEVSPHKKIAALLIFGHGEYDNDKEKYIGVFLGQESEDPAKSWFLGEHSIIPENAFAPLAGGKLAFISCNALDPGTSKIMWVDAIAKHAPDTTVIAAKEPFDASNIRVDANGMINIAFQAPVLNFPNDVTFQDISYTIQPIKQTVDAETASSLNPSLVRNFIGPTSKNDSRSDVAMLPIKKL